MVGIIKYFEWQHQGIAIPEGHLGNFMPCLKTVEEWMNLDEVTRQDAQAKMNYYDKFNLKMK